jgi:hypothetical protein
MWGIISELIVHMTTESIRIGTEATGTKTDTEIEIS